MKKPLVKKQEAIASPDISKITRKTKSSPEKATPAETPAVNDTIQVPGLCCGIDLADLKPVRISVAGIDEMQIGAVEDEIVKACGNLKEQAGVAVRAGILVIAHAWQCGKFLNRAKDILKSGGFGKWRDEKLIEPGLMSTVTSQRHMALARNWDRLEDLLLSGTSLRAAYQDCGILPHDASKPEGAQNGQDGVIVIAEDAFLKEVDRMQDTLRRHGANVSKISEQGREHLKLARAGINEIFAIVLGEKVEPDPEHNPDPAAKKAPAKPGAKRRGK